MGRTVRGRQVNTRVGLSCDGGMGPWLQRLHPGIHGDSVDRGEVGWGGGTGPAGNPP